jgi:5-methylcytosine-specific restriction protein A
VRDGSGYCQAHKRAIKKEVESRRETSNKRGYGYKWQKAREGYLRSHPLCTEHEQRGEIVKATVVDHIIPHKGDMELFWNRNNWQSLCKDCHDIKTAREDGRWGGGA